LAARDRSCGADLSGAFIANKELAGNFPLMLCGLPEYSSILPNSPIPKSDTIVMLGSGKPESWTGIPKSARNVMNSDEL
jgi:hypothetical protein